MISIYDAIQIGLLLLIGVILIFFVQEYSEMNNANDSCSSVGMILEKRSSDFVLCKGVSEEGKIIYKLVKK